MASAKSGGISQSSDKRQDFPGGGSQIIDSRRGRADSFGKLIKNCLEVINLYCISHTLTPPFVIITIRTGPDL